jgi:hypothetical protein
LQAIAGIDTRLREVLDAVEDSNPQPVLDVVRRLEARPDPDLTPIIQAFEKSDAAIEEKLQASAEVAHEQGNLLVQAMKSLTNVESSLTRMDTDHKSGSTSLHEIVQRVHDKPLADLSPVLDAIANVDMTKVINHIDEVQAAHTENMDKSHLAVRSSLKGMQEAIVNVDLDRVLTTITESHSAVQESHSSMQATLTAIVEQPPPDLEPVLEALGKLDSAITLNHEALTDDVAKHDLVPVQETIDRIDAKPPTNLVPVMASLKMLEGLLGATLSLVKGGDKKERNMMWQTPQAIC